MKRSNARRMSRKSNILFRLSAALLCLLALSSCGMFRRVPSLPSQDGSTQPSQTTSDRQAVTDTAKAVVDIKSPADKKAKDITVEDRTVQREIIKIAKSKLGCRYSYAGKGPNTFDCSGFTGWVFKQVGVTLGASSRDQYLQGRALQKDEPLRPGDLVFWNGRSVGNTVGHVGIVVDYDKSDGSFTFIHAAVSTGIELMRSTSDYYSRRYMGARRILE